MISFNENTNLLGQLLYAENVRNKVAGLRVQRTQLASFRSENLEKTTMYLCVLEGIIPTDTSFDQFKQICETGNRKTASTGERKTISAIDRIRKLVSITKKIGTSLMLNNSELHLSLDTISGILNSSNILGFRDSSSFAIISTINHFPYRENGYVPPKANDVKSLLDEVCDYVNCSIDHPIIKASSVLYQILTIWPFTRYNITLAHLLSEMVLDAENFDLGGLSCPAESFARARDIKYSACLTMDLPNFYYSGRNNPPKPEIWHDFYMNCFNESATQALANAKKAAQSSNTRQFVSLNKSEKNLVKFLKKSNAVTARPVDIARYFNVTNKTATNWLQKLSTLGLVRPNDNQQRVTEYSVLM